MGTDYRPRRDRIVDQVVKGNAAAKQATKTAQQVRAQRQQSGKK